MNKTKAVIFDAIDSIRTGEVTLPECKPNQLVAKTIYAFVSPGTELRVLGGHYGAEGNYPMVPGYSAISEVISCGSDVKGFRKGDLISCRNSVDFADCRAMWGGQAGMHVYDTEDENAPILLPENVSDVLPYAAAEVAAISLRGVESADPQPYETALVIGQGLIGQFSAMYLKQAGCRVTVCDIDDNRLAESREAGCAAAINLTEADAEERLKRLGNGGYDIVVEASGSTPGVELAFRMLRRKPQNYSTDYKVEPIRFYSQNYPKLIFQANYLKDVSINPHGFFAGEGVTILTPADRGIEDRQRAVELIRSGKVDVTPFLKNVCKVEDMPEMYHKLQQKKILTLIGDWR